MYQHLTTILLLDSNSLEIFVREIDECLEVNLLLVQNTDVLLQPQTFQEVDHLVV